MTDLSVRDLTVLRAGHAVLHQASFTAPSGSLTCVLGLAGAGKTTLLAAIAGLLQAEQGAVLLGGADVTRLDSRRRGVGFLTPGSTLAGGRTLAERLARLAGVDGAARVGLLVDALGLGAATGQDAGLLSHGQAALALAAARLLPVGGVLLVDEAGAGLDAPSSASFTAVLRDLAASGRTVLAATRCPVMAQEADRLVLLSGGRVLQEGPPWAVYAAPNCADAAGLTGPANVLQGTVREKRPGGFVWAASGRFLQACAPDRPAPTLGSAVSLCLRPEQLLVLGGQAGQNAVEGQVIDVRRVCGVATLSVLTPLGRVHVAVPAWGRPSPGSGAAIRLGWAADAAWVMAPC